MIQKQPNNDTDTGACLLWFRFDLRLADHEGVQAALATGLPIIPVYIYDESLGSRPLGAASKWWLHRSLRALDKALRIKASKLIVRSGNAQNELADLSKENNVKRIICSHSFDPELERQDEDLASYFKARGIVFERYNTTLLCPPNHVRTKTDEPYRVFTPFYRALVSQGLCKPNITPDKASEWRAVKDWPYSASIDSLRLNQTLTRSGKNWASGFDIWTPGEKGARLQLDRFLENGLSLYADQRDRADIDATSRLSPHLRFGEISSHRILYELDKARLHGKGIEAHAEKFQAELVWREFSYGLLAQQPRLHQLNFKSGYEGMKWQNDSADFKAWKAGMTGYSLVDAGMRELWQTGFMHNRVRMVAASFLIKHLLIDWRQGEECFWDCLVDADPANNPASWQWVAGCGADASPYFRIFNPITQAEKFDPKAIYRSKFIQGYSHASVVSAHKKDTHDLFDIPEKSEIYPQPIIDHSFARNRALAVFDERQK